MLSDHWGSLSITHVSFNVQHISSLDDSRQVFTSSVSSPCITIKSFKVCWGTQPCLPTDSTTLCWWLIAIILVPINYHLSLFHLQAAPINHRAGLHRITPRQSSGCLKLFFFFFSPLPSKLEMNFLLSFVGVWTSACEPSEGRRHQANATCARTDGRIVARMHVSAKEMKLEDDRSAALS